MKYIIALFLLTTLSFAQDCGTLNDGQTIRLDAIGGPLENATIKDQDGIGNCYAQDLALAIQAITPNHPDISANQISWALAQKRIDEASNKSPIITNDNNNKSLALESSYYCHALQAAKEKSQGVCQTKDVPLDQILLNPQSKTFQDSAKIQKEILWAVSLFYEKSLQLSNKDRQLFFKLLTENSTIETRNFFCAKENSEQIRNLFKAKTFNIKHSKNIDPDLETIQKSFGQTTPLKSGEDYIYFNDFFLENFESSIREAQQKELTSFASPTDLFLNFLKDNIKVKNPKAYQDFLKTFSPNDLKKLEEIYLPTKSQSKECQEQAAFNQLKDAKKMIQKLGAGCSPELKETLTTLEQMSRVLESSHIVSAAQLQKNLLQPSGNYLQFLQNLLAADCKTNSKIAINKLSCKESPIWYKRYLYDQKQSDSLANREQFLKDSKIKMSNIVLEQLAKKIPSSVALCFSMFRNPQHQYTFSGECDDELHSMAITGIKCEKGKRLYLLQNSHGTWEALKAVRDNQGKNPFGVEIGKAWVPELILIQNTYILSNISY